MSLPGPHTYVQMAGYSIQETTYNIKACRNRRMRKCKDAGLKDARDTGCRITPNASQPGGHSKEGPADLEDSRG